ncbi:hypothetical protein [Cystobacter fuscus]|uniref:hypothetical protein n=1 Tax=Cystobacter fuscus TaxID=43 RepID=UPI002B312488|nr:hypothetical protein F0U63_25500 [Cystobacter fuscus]
MSLKKVSTTASIVVATLWVGLVGGCGGTAEESSSDPRFQGDNLSTGEPWRGGSIPPADEGNTPAGEDNGWVTLCHVPPGNPSQAHTITVGQPAVKAHLMHGDTLDACESGTGSDGGTTDPGGSDAGTPDPGTDGGTGSPDAGPSVCVPRGNECGTSAECCSGLQCSAGVCSIILN